MTRRIIVGMGILLGSMISRPALAHDPYEIVSTAYLHSNRLDLEVQMEFNTAMLVAGVNRREHPDVSEGDLFGRVKPQLEAVAAKFFEVLAGGGELPLRQAGVSLGVENHVQFELTYAQPDKQPLRFKAIGLRALEGLGPYGTALTVLDMVNQKVLGQPVLFPDSPEIEVEVPSIINRTSARFTDQAVDERGTVWEPAPDVASAPETIPAEEAGSGPASRWWIWVIVLVVLTDIIFLAVWLSNRGSRRAL